MIECNLIYNSRNYKRPIASIYLQNYIKYSELGRTLKYICNKKSPLTKILYIQTNYFIGCQAYKSNKERT